MNLFSHLNPLAYLPTYGPLLKRNACSQKQLAKSKVDKLNYEIIYLGDGIALGG